MRINTTAGNIVDVPSDVAIVNLFEGVSRPAGATGAADKHLGGLISQLVDDGEVSGKLGATTLLHAYGNGSSEGPKRVLVVGLGNQDAFDLQAIRTASAAAIHRVKRIAKTATTIVHGAGIGGIDPSAAARAVAEGTMLGAYAFNTYKNLAANEAPRLESLNVVEFDADKIDAAQSGIASGLTVSRAQNLARDLVNEPANVLTPSAMRQAAEGVASRNNLAIRIMNQGECVREGMAAFCGVARGSSEPAYFVHITHEGAPDHPEQNIWLLGKSITFDSGGLSLKSSAGMRKMKGDMGGGAAVLGAMQAIGELKPPINVHAVLPITENMPGGNAQRPGDIVNFDERA